MNRFLLALFLSMVFTATHAQTDFFSFSPSDYPPDFSPRPPPPIKSVLDQWPVGVNVRGLAESHGSIAVELWDNEVITFVEETFEAVEGFQLVGFEFVPDPDIPDSGLSFRWTGTSGNRTMTFSVWQGSLSGTIIDDQWHYAITEVSPNNAVIRVMDPEVVTLDTAFGGAADNRSKAMGAFLDAKEMARKGVATDPFAVIDVLVLHTPAALAAAGSQAQLNAIIDESFLQSQTIRDNSGIENHRFRNALAQSGNGGGNQSLLFNYNEVSGQACPPPNNGTPLCNYFGHRVRLRTSAAVQNLRNQNDADMVVLLVSDDPNAPAVGVAYTQNTDCANDIAFGENVAGCNPGPAYNNFAYSVVTVDFATSFQVFAHETGHQLGMEHQQNAADANPSFPFSHGHFAANVNQSVMSTVPLFGCACPRALHYSNPDVPFLGTATPSGTPTRRNARTGSLLAYDVSLFRGPMPPTDRLFINGFELLDIPN